MRPVRRIQLLARLLGTAEPTTIVDIGANPFNGAPPYAVMRRSGTCRVVGFEPQPEALASLRQAAGPNEVYLPYAVGDGTDQTLYVTKNSGLVSTLAPAPWIGRYLNPWWQRAIAVEETLSMPTRRLDDIDDIGRIDLLKIDIQGGELAVFRHGRAKLAQAAMIQTEVPLLAYYEGQPSFGDVQAELAAQGFIAWKIAEIARHVVGYPRALAPGLDLPKTQVTGIDVVFLRNPVDMAALASETVRHMALLADAVYGAPDLTLRCLGALADRGDLRARDLAPYVAVLREAHAAKTPATPPG